MTVGATPATEPRITWHNAWGHFCTITQHKLLVMRYCWRVGLYRQALAHDISKYAPSEFLVGARYYQGHRSPNTAERVAKGYSEAWMHHKGRNKHHTEYWTDIRGNGDATFEGKPMPTRYVVEMFCDRVAACKVYQGEAYTDRSALDYYELERTAGPILIHPDTDALLRRLVTMLAEQGEEATFREIRETIVKPRYFEGEHGRF